MVTNATRGHAIDLQSKGDDTGDEDESDDEWYEQMVRAAQASPTTVPVPATPPFLILELED